LHISTKKGEEKIVNLKKQTSSITFCRICVFYVPKYTIHTENAGKWDKKFESFSFFLILAPSQAKKNTSMDLQQQQPQPVSLTDVEAPPAQININSYSSSKELPLPTTSTEATKEHKARLNAHKHQRIASMQKFQKSWLPCVDWYTTRPCLWTLLVMLTTSMLVAWFGLPFGVQGPVDILATPPSPPPPAAIKAATVPSSNFLIQHFPTVETVGACTADQRPPPATDYPLHEPAALNFTLTWLQARLWNHPQWACVAAPLFCMPFRLAVTYDTTSPQTNRTIWFVNQFHVVPCSEETIQVDASNPFCPTVPPVTRTYHKSVTVADRNGQVHHFHDDRALCLQWMADLFREGAIEPCSILAGV
jgi:hypothetical protein